MRISKLRSSQASNEKKVEIDRQRNCEHENENAYLWNRLHGAGYPAELPLAGTMKSKSRELALTNGSNKVTSHRNKACFRYTLRHQQHSRLYQTGAFSDVALVRHPAVSR